MVFLNTKYLRFFVMLIIFVLYFLKYLSHFFRSCGVAVKTGKLFLRLMVVETELNSTSLVWYSFHRRWLSGALVPWSANSFFLVQLFLIISRRLRNVFHRNLTSHYIVFFIPVVSFFSAFGSFLLDMRQPSALLLSFYLGFICSPLSSTITTEIELGLCIMLTEHAFK